MTTTISITCNSGHEHDTFEDLRACQPAPMIRNTYRVVDPTGRIHMALNGDAKTVCGRTHDYPASRFPIKAQNVHNLFTNMDTLGEPICKRCRAYSY